VDVSPEELEKRAKAWKPRKPKITTGYLARYAAMVTSGSRGAVLQVPGEKSKGDKKSDADDRSGNRHRLPERAGSGYGVRVSGRNDTEYLRCTLQA
jgi:hypothetical protein